MAEMNIDAQLLREGSARSSQEPQVVELSNGCICCTLRDELLQEVAGLTAAGAYDYLIIESTGKALEKTHRLAGQQNVFLR